MVLQFTIPYPPSLNTYWRHVGAKTLLSKAGREYRNAVAAEVFLARVAKHLCGRLWVALDVYPPDNRRRDLDNLPKAILDALGRAGVYEDDSQIDGLIVIRRETDSPGRIEVLVREIT